MVAAVLALAVVAVAGCTGGGGEDMITNVDGDVVVGGPEGPGGSGVVARATEGGVHWGRYTVNDQPQADIRFVVITDRQTDPQAVSALPIFVRAWNSLWARYPALPYLLVADQHSIGVCTGHFGSSVIQICTGNPSGGLAGYTHYNIDPALHFSGPYILNRDQSTVGWAYTLICHEVGHALGLDHSGETASCMHSRLTGESRGYTPSDFRDLINLYYSHFPG